MNDGASLTSPPVTWRGHQCFIFWYNGDFTSYSDYLDVSMVTSDGGTRRLSLWRPYVSSSSLETNCIFNNWWKISKLDIEDSEAYRVSVAIIRALNG